MAWWRVRRRFAGRCAFGELARQPRPGLVLAEVLGDDDSGALQVVRFGRMQGTVAVPAMNSEGKSAILEPGSFSCLDVAWGGSALEPACHFAVISQLARPPVRQHLLRDDLEARRRRDTDLLGGLRRALERHPRRAILPLLALLRRRLLPLVLFLCLLMLILEQPSELVRLQLLHAIQIEHVEIERAIGSVLVLVLSEDDLRIVLCRRVQYFVVFVVDEDGEVDDALLLGLGGYEWGDGSLPDGRCALGRPGWFLKLILLALVAVFLQVLDLQLL